jgi:thioredoxin-related protein
MIFPEAAVEYQIPEGQFMTSVNSKRVMKGIEIGTNIAIMIVALSAALFFSKNYLLKSDRSRHLIAAGAKLDGEQINWNNSPKNVALVLSTTCHFCKESTRFYRELVRECNSRQIRTIAFFPQSLEAGRAYLEAEGVSINEVRQAEFKALKVSGTPTLLLVDNNGIVQHVWIGKLTAAKEKEVLARVAF